MRIAVDETFQVTYASKVLDGLPNSDREAVLYYPGATSTGGNDGIIVEVTQGDLTWIGVFKFGYDSPCAVSAVLACPDQRSICVISKGAGYIVACDSPTSWWPLDPMPITVAVTTREPPLLLVGDFTALLAVGACGVVWRTGPLYSDELAILTLRTGFVDTQGWDASRGQTVSFRTSLTTGASAPLDW